MLLNYMAGSIRSGFRVEGPLMKRMRMVLGSESLWSIPHSDSNIYHNEMYFLKLSDNRISYGICPLLLSLPNTLTQLIQFLIRSDDDEQPNQQKDWMDHYYFQDV